MLCSTGTFHLWGRSIQVDWAAPERDVDEEVMQRVRVLYVSVRQLQQKQSSAATGHSLPLLSVLQVRNLMLSTTEETLLQEFSRFKPGSVEHVKKLKDYAFVHYRCRDDAMTALGLMNGAQIDGADVEVMLAKPARMKDLSVDTRRHSSKGYFRNAKADGGGGAGTFLQQRSNRGMAGSVDRGTPLRSVSLPTHLGSPVCSAAAGEEALQFVCVTDD